MTLVDVLPMGNPELSPMWKRSGFSFTPAVFLSYPPANYINPDERGPLLYYFNSMFFTIMLVCVALRLYTRLCIRKYFGLDDVFIVCALVGAIGVTASVMLGFHTYYWNRHVWDIPFNAIEPSAKLSFASKILWSFTSNSVRASVMCLYYRLVDHIGIHKHRWILHVNSAFIFGLFIAQQATAIFACSPIKTAWTWPPIVTGKCMDYGSATFAEAVLNTFSEAVVAALPLPIILTLPMSNSQRRLVVALLCGGVFVVVVGCVRVYFVWQTFATYDPSWWAQPHWICSEVEMDVAIICACVPVLTPMLSRVFSHGLSAANKADPDSPALGSDFRANRARSLFSKLKEQTSLTGLSLSTARSGSTGRPPSTQEDIDLEGISNDGFGYSVTITTGRGTKVRRRWDIRNKTWHYYPEEPVSDLEEIKSTAGSKDRPPVFRVSGLRKKSLMSLHANDTEKTPTGVRTEKTFEVRESFQSERFDRGFDYRNPYKNGMPGKYEEEIEIALQVPEVEVSDWSLFDGEINRRMAARILPDDEVKYAHKTSPSDPIPSSPAVPASVQQKRPGSSYEEQRYFTLQRRSTIDSVRPRTGSSRNSAAHKASRSHDYIRVGVLPSPSTIAFEERAGPPSTPRKDIRKSPSPPPLPPSARFPRSVSPATQPLNSSQLWASPPHMHQQRNSPSPTESTTQETESSGTYTTAVPTGVGGAPSKVAAGWKKSSLHSSMKAENGSGHSVMGTGLRPPPPQLHRRDDESSDEEFSLPLQRPSPRTSTVEQRRLEQAKTVPTVTVKEHI